MSRDLAIRLDEETASMTQDRLAEEAVRCYSREKEQYIKAVQQGQDDVRAGRVISHNDLVKELESRLADLD